MKELRGRKTARSRKQKKGDSQSSFPKRKNRSTIFHVFLQFSVAWQAKPTGYQLPNVLSRGPDHNPKVRFAGSANIQTTQHLGVGSIRIVSTVEHVFRLIEGEQRIGVSAKGDSVDRPECVEHDKVECCSAGLTLEFPVQATSRDWRISERFLDK